MATTVVFGGGPTSTVAVDRALEGTGIDVVIAADSGLVACTAAGLDADVVIGDMDSVPPELLEQAASRGARVEIRPADKDATDLELALDLALELSKARSGRTSEPAGSERLLAIGSDGGRLDHLVAGMALLGSARYAAMEIEGWLGFTRVIPVRGRRRISAEVGSTVSLLALHGRCDRRHDQRAAVAAGTWRAGCRDVPGCLESLPARRDRRRRRRPEPGDRRHPRSGTDDNQGAEMKSNSCPRRTGIASTLLACALLGACGDDGAATDADDRDADPPTVRVLTYDAFALSEDAAAAFEEATGATIEIIAAGDGAAMLAGALLTAGSPEADVIFGIDNTTAAEVASAPLLVDYTPAAASDLPAELAAPSEVAGQLTPIDTSEVCINVDESWFADKGLVPPSGFDDLTDPAYRGLLSVQSPVNSTPGLAFLMGTIDTYGDDGFETYWGALADNDVRVAPSWDDAYYNDYTVSGGDRPLVVSYASSPPAEVVFSEGARNEPVSSVLEATCVTQVEYAGVLEGAEHPELAEQLVAFMLTDDWQSELALSNFVYPVTDVELPPEFQQWAPRPENAIKVDAEMVGESRDEWIEQWRSVME